jgi:N-acetylmuramoyl-L-alanine amidase
MKLLFALLILLSGALHAAPSRPFIVCIDPGHPSETSAGASAHGLSENRLNWQVALRVAAKLRAKNIAFVLTKKHENERVTNRRRAEIANGDNPYKSPADAFIRLHCDAGGGSGFAWFYPDRAATKQGVTGPPRDVQIASRQLAHVMNEAMKPVLKNSLRANAIKTDAATYVGGKQGGVLTGSIFSRVPTALLEMCYITNKRDAKFLGSIAGQEKMADALVAGIEAWKKSYVH